MFAWIIVISGVVVSTAQPAGQAATPHVTGALFPNRRLCMLTLPSYVMAEQRANYMPDADYARGYPRWVMTGAKCVRVELPASK